MKGSFLFAQILCTLSKTHTITLTSWTLLGSWKDTWSQDPGHLTLLVPDVTHYGCWLCHAFLPTPSHSGTGPSCELVVTGYITTMYSSAVHLYAVHSIGATLRPKLLTWVKWSMWYFLQVLMGRTLHWYILIFISESMVSACQLEINFECLWIWRNNLIFQIFCDKDTKQKFLREKDLLKSTRESRWSRLVAAPDQELQYQGNKDLDCKLQLVFHYFKIHSFIDNCWQWVWLHFI